MMIWFFILSVWFYVLLLPVNTQQPINSVKLLIEEKPKYIEHTVIVNITGYSSRKCETDSTPFITATSDSVQVGIIALSPDLIKQYGYHHLVKIEGFNKLFVVKDTMNKRFTNCADIWFPNTQWAIDFGVKQGWKIKILIPAQIIKNSELYTCNIEIPIRGT